MTMSPGSLLRPATSADYRGKSTLRALGFTVAAVGFMVAMVAFISSLVQAGLVAGDGTASGIATQDAWTFGVSSTALVIVKIGIALILWGILRRLWVRVESINPNPPKDTDGRREGSGRGWVRELQGRWPGVLG